jgi:hypothetical protein
MANTQITTDYVANKLTTPFVSSLGALRFANTEYTSVYEKHSGQGVPLGSSVQMRLQPTYPVNSTSTSTNGDLSLTVGNFQQETISIDVDEFLHVAIELNAIEHQLRVGTAEDVIEDQYIKPARQALTAAVKKKIYNAFLTQSYYQIDDGSSSLTSVDPVNNIRAAMTSLNMDKTRYLGLSPFDQSTLSSSLTGIFNTTFNEEALEMGLVHPKFMAFETYEDENIEEFEAGTSSAASVGSLTLNSDVVNGATSLDIANASGATVTFVAGDAIEYRTIGTPAQVNINYFFVGQIDQGGRRKVPPQKISLKSVVVAPSASEVSAGTFPAWNAGLQAYEIANAANALVKISRAILTNLTGDNFAYINAEYTGDGSAAGEIAATTPIIVFGNRNINMGFVRNSLYIASPAPEVIKNSDFAIKRENGLSVVVAQQGTLVPNFSNKSLVGLMIGVRFNPQGITALNTSSS